jgi:hypothetical protein
MVNMGLQLSGRALPSMCEALDSIQQHKRKTKQKIILSLLKEVIARLLALQRLRQEYLKCKVSLNHIVRPCLKINKGWRCS